MGTEVITYSRIGKQDIRFGKGTFEVVLADGRKVTLDEVDIGAILNQASLSSPIYPGFVNANLYSSISDAVSDAPEGATVLVPYGEYEFESLNINKTITVQGIGWHNSVQGSFGDSGYTSGVTGSVLRCTKASGTAITCQTIGKGPRFKNLAIVGPGSGTATAIAMGDSTNYQLNGKWDDVFIGNFYQGVVLTNVEDWTFDTIRLRGISTYGWLLQDGGAGSPNTNQNLFLNCEMQYCGMAGIRITEANTNRFVGGLFQNNGRDIQFAASSLGSINNISFDGLWFESTSTPPIEWDLTNGGPIGVHFLDCHMTGSGDAWTVTGAGSRVIMLTLTGNTWQSRDVTIAASRFDGVSHDNNRFNSYTDNSNLVTFGGPMKATIMATADLPAASALMDGTVMIEDGVGLIHYSNGQRFRHAGIAF